MDLIENTQETVRRLCPYRVNELLTGVCTYPLPDYYTGYGNAREGHQDEDLAPYITDEMKADWFANREKLLQLWNGEADEKELFGHLQLPWLSRGSSDLPWGLERFEQSGNSPRETKPR